MILVALLYTERPNDFDLSCQLSAQLHKPHVAAYSPFTSGTVEPEDRDVVALCQASILRQWHGLLSGQRTLIESAQLFAPTMIHVRMNWAES